jgi:hypothetical protein
MKAYFSFLYLKTKYDINRMIDNFYLWFVWKLPHKLVYWCGIRLGAHASTGQWGADNITTVKFFEVLNRWEIKHEETTQSQETFMPAMQTAQDGSGDPLEEQRITQNRIGREGNT